MAHAENNLLERFRNPRMLAGVLGFLSSFSIESDFPPQFAYISLGILGVMLLCYWEDIGAFIKKYIRYLYISIIYFVILGLALASFEQTETLFVGILEDTSSWNMILFWIQFPSSIIIVWFLPYYLMFSDIYYKDFLSGTDLQKIKRWHLLINIILPIGVMINLIKTDNELRAKFIAFNKSSREDHSIFHRVRRVLGAIYICILCNLLAGVSLGIGDSNIFSNYPVSIAGLIVVGFYVLISWYEDLAKQTLGPVLQLVIRKDKKEGHNGHRRLGFSLFIILGISVFALLAAWGIGVYNGLDNLYSISFATIIAGLAIWIVFLIFKKREGGFPTSIEGDAAGNAAILESASLDDTQNHKIGLTKKDFLTWINLLPLLISASLVIGLALAIILIFQSNSLILESRLFLWAGFNMLFGFMGLAYFRRRGRYETGLNRIWDRLVYWLDNPGTIILMMWNTGFVILFFCSFISTLVHFESHFANGANNINPLNLFFIFINGLMVFIAFLDRAIVMFTRFKNSNNPDGVPFLQRILNRIFGSTVPAELANDTDDGLTTSTNVIDHDSRRDLQIYHPLRLKLYREEEVVKSDEEVAKSDEEIAKRDEETIEGPYSRVELFFGRQGRLPIRIRQILICSIAVCFVLNKCAGEYHQINYEAEPSAKQLSLEAYTEQFLATRQSASRNEQCPIYIIASDGGGLKAAYWTTRLLHSLETQSSDQFDFRNDVFVSAGASGGSVGLGLYTYMYADPSINHDEIDKRIHALGGYNFLSADFGGLLTRWPYKFVPFKCMSKLADRMDVMGRNYFGNVSQVKNPNCIDIYHDPLFTNAYDYIWQQNNYKLPLFINNTARVEDGSKGIMHPLDPAEAHNIFGGVMDLTYQNLNKESRIQEHSKAISFPDALMTTNRFPIFSPMAKIEGKGHFVDAGAVDNSGKGTLLQMLQYMKQKSLEGEPDNVFKRFFDNEIVMISIRCDKQRYFYATFKDFSPLMQETEQLYYLPSFLSGAINTGLTGNPRAYEGMLDDSIHRKSFGLDAEVLNLSIPFYIESMDEIFEVLGSSVDPDSDSDRDIYCKMDSIRCASNQRLISILGEGIAKGRPPYLEPPLARMLSQSSRIYMDCVADNLAKGFYDKLIAAKHPDAWTPKSYSFGSIKSQSVPYKSLNTATVP